MKVPVSWLRELVDIDAPVTEIADRLAMSGTGVEEIITLGGNVSGIVVGRVLEKERVEGSDKLVRTQIDLGDGNTSQICAGASNFEVGDLVPVAVPGARVTTLDVPIGKRKMAGVESNGMLCSATELGLGEDHGGILVLDPTMPVGADAVELLGLKDEVLDLEITSNRPDCLSVFGIAREVSVLFNVPLHGELERLEEGHTPADTLAKVSIDSPGCPHYLARVISDVVWGPSPVAVQRRIAAAGMRPISNLVDATNYVLLLTGQPLHAFDLAKLNGSEIVVRQARSGEKLRAIDESVLELDPDDLVIADAERPVALAGVMGGADTEVSETTRHVLLESAHFLPGPIARSARRHGMSTEASKRFERGADPGALGGAAALCAELMRRWASGHVAAGEIDVGSTPGRERIVLRRGRIAEIFGVEVPADETDRILTGLGCATTPSSSEVEVVPPTFRPDLEREIDLIEEVSRIHGFDVVGYRVPTAGTGGLTHIQRVRRTLRATLLGCGLNELTLQSFVTDDDLNSAGYTHPVLRIDNPQSVEQEALRPTLAINLMRHAGRETARGSGSVAGFEIGSVFSPWTEAGTDLPPQAERIGIVLAGSKPASWLSGSEPFDVWDIKGILEPLIGALASGFEVDPLDVPWLHPGRAGVVTVEGRSVGWFGTARPSVAGAFGAENLQVAELDLARLVELAPEEVRASMPPRHPSVRRDISAVVPDSVASSSVMETARSAAGEYAEGVHVLSVYRGEQIPAGHHSLALRLELRAPDKTLTDAEADAARQRAVDALQQQLGIETR